MSLMLCYTFAYLAMITTCALVFDLFKERHHRIVTKAVFALILLAGLSGLVSVWKVAPHDFTGGTELCSKN